MRERNKIEKEFHGSGREKGGGLDRGSIFFDIVDNQKLILEALLDIRDLLSKKRK